MSVTGRQNNLFLAEDWKRVYQAFKNADFTSYDFENLRRVMISYLRENYPEDFNDYIESSEYLALIDLIAFLGQSLAFRMDLNARENFLELAERRESVLRLARLLSYNVRRNVAATGLLKIETIATSEEVNDSSGRNIQGLAVSWNDPTNSNWFDQFTKIINAAMTSDIEFGTPITYDTINNIYTEQYRLNSTSSDLALSSFIKSIDGKTVAFEITSTKIQDGTLVEEAPLRGRQYSLVFRDDTKGYGSVNTGWFMNFVQGNINSLDFNINNPTTNEIVNIDTTNINDTDVWLYSLTDSGVENGSPWISVPNLIGNNIIYNSLDKVEKNIYQIQTRANDTISLVFGDGIFSNLPKGSFRCYYRTSNNLTYTINPKDMRNISLQIPYISRKGTLENLKLGLSLKTSVTNGSISETNDDVKINAPTSYYTQNRMITGEDYNLAPLSASQNIAKIKTINRTTTGISRNFDLLDASGKYSTTSSFCTDGVIYREDVENKIEFRFVSRTDIESLIKNKIEPLTKLSMVRDFYYEKYTKLKLTELNPIFNQVTSSYNETTGYVADKDVSGFPFKVGPYTGSSLKYIEPGALVKLIPPIINNVQYYFTPTGGLTSIQSSNTLDRIWTKIISVVGDGTANGTGILSNGLGPIVFNEVIPTNAIVEQIIPKYITYISENLKSLLVDLIFNFRNFGLRYDFILREWVIIQERNLNLLSPWSLDKAGDNSGQKLDSSWIILFETDGEKYTVTYRGLEYFFESIKENRFFFDGSKKIFDITTNKLQKDKVNVLKFNTKPNSSEGLARDYVWEIVGTAATEDTYSSSKAVKITFSDKDDDGIVDNPDSFNIIVDTTTTSSFIFFEKYVTDGFIEDYRYIENTGGKFIILQSENLVTNLLDYNDGQLFYFYGPDIVKKLDLIAGKLVITKDYYANIGRSAINFHYLHNADSTTRIDPSSSNILDLYILTKNYDTEYRKYLKGDITDEPLPPSSTELKQTYGKNLDKIKSISDDLIYHPVKYKVLFGEMADVRLQASFKVVKNKEKVITDNDIKTRVIQAINEFFALDNWDFGDTFYFTELSTYVMNQVTPFITSFLIVPLNNEQVFGSLQQIKSAPNELFISGARVSNVEIIEAITATNLKAQGYIITTSNFDVNTTNLRSSTNSG